MLTLYIFKQVSEAQTCLKKAKNQLLKREDGFYCVKSDGKNENLSCMPSYKGVTGLGKKQMNKKTAQILKEFYQPSFSLFEENFGAKFSWMKDEVER